MMFTGIWSGAFAVYASKFGGERKAKKDLKNIMKILLTALIY